METRRNAMLAELARDAEMERSDFLVRAGEQLDRFMRSHGGRIRDLGGLVLIDEDPDYLAVAPDGTFRSRSRVFDQATGEWVSETEVVETAAELAELYNPADILQAFADAEALGAGAEDAEDTGEDGAEPATDPYAAAADQWAAGQPDVPEARDEESAATALYELALDFQDRSQRTEAGLIEQFENASAGLLGLVGTLTIVDDTDEQLTLGLGGFRGRVVPEGEGGWAEISTPDAIVRYYDPTDVFGDLAEAIADAYPSVAEADEEDDEAEADEAEDDEDDEDDEAEDEADDEDDETDDEADDDEDDEDDEDEDDDDEDDAGDTGDEADAEADEFADIDARQERPT